MIADTLRLLSRDFPAVMLILALLIAAINPTRGPAPERFLSWVLLLPIGLTGLWAGAFHIFLPGAASADIGWHASPFEFEVGMADLAIGITACVAFWQDLSFKAAAVLVASSLPTRRCDRTHPSNAQRGKLFTRKRGRAVLHRHHRSASRYRLTVA